MKSKSLFWSSLTACTLLGAMAACQSSDTGRTPAPPDVDPGAPLAPGPEETVGGDYDLARVTFEQRGAGFRGSHDTHQVDVTNGLIEIAAVDPRAAVVRKSPTFALQTELVARGEMVFDSTPISSALRAANVVETVRGGYTERVRNAPEGIEQSWHFEREPAGQGDLMVAISASGADYQGSTPNGLHFRRPGELGLRYSHATWIEADGERWDITASYDNGRIVLSVPAEVISSSDYPAVLDPTVTAELLTDTPVLGSSGADNADGDVAGDGSGNFLVVWQDRRNTRADDIWGTRVNASGAVVDTRGIKIYENATTTEQRPVVAWIGNSWLVVWESAGNIAAARVAANGAVTQLGAVASTAAAETAPKIAARGTGALVTWMVDGADVSASLFSGTAFGAPFAIAATAAAEKSPAVAAAPAGEYLVVFQEGSASDNIRGQRVTAAGALSGAVFDISTEVGTQASPTVDWNGTDFVVVWSTSTGTVDLRAARVNTAGVALDASPGVTVSNAPDQQTFPDISCAAGSCWISWQDRRNLATSSFDVYGATLSTTMSLGTETIISTAARAQSTTAVARSGSQWLTVWTDLRDGEVRGMFATRVTAAGAVMDAAGVQLGRGMDRHSAPVVSRTSSIWSVMWGASRRADYDAVHVRYNTNGGQLDAAPLDVSAAPASQLPSGSVFVGGNLMAVWTDDRGGDSRDVYAARINPSTGAPIEANGFAISTAVSDQAGAKIATNGTTSLVVWQDRRNASFDIFGALVNANGTIAVPEFLICANPGDQTRPAVAYDSTNGAYLVAWSDANGQATTDIRAARVSAAGALLDAGCGAAISAADGSQSFPDIAFASNRFFVSWEDRRTDPNGDIFGARVSIAGGAIAVQDATGIAVSAVANTAQSAPTVTAYNGNFVVVWEDARNFATTKWDIFGARVVAASGLAEAAFAISTGLDDERSPDITDGPTTNSPAKVAYLRSRPDLDTVRVQVRRITFQTSTGAACSNNAQCASGFCVDSRCCDTACGGGSLSDCQACSVARGAAIDGVCSPLAGPNIYMCRNYAQIPGICDVREYCNGVDTSCPPDLGINQGVVCNATRGTVCPSNSAAGAPHRCP